MSDISHERVGAHRLDRALTLYQLAPRRSREDTFRLFMRLTEEDPLHWDPYTKTWLAADREAVLRVLSDETFSSRPQRVVHPDLESGDSSQPGIGRVHDFLARQLLFADGTAHARLRRLVQQVLSRRQIQRLVPRITSLLDELLERAESGVLDMVGGLAQPLPFIVTAELLGFPETDWEQLKQFSAAYTRVVTGFDLTIDHATISQFNSLIDYALDFVRRKRRAPSNDGVSVLIAGADAAGGFEDIDLAANLAMLLAAGHQTTTGFIAGSVLEWISPMAEFPAIHLGSTPPDVEGMLARVSPSRFIGRTATATTTIKGRRIEEGQTVLVLLAATNWNTLVQAERANKREGELPHIAFGHGPHHCPGAALARLEGEIVFSKLFQRWKDPRLLIDSVKWSENVNLPCPMSLPIRAIGGAG